MNKVNIRDFCDNCFHKAICDHKNKCHELSQKIKDALLTTENINTTNNIKDTFTIDESIIFNIDTKCNYFISNEEVMNFK